MSDENEDEGLNFTEHEEQVKETDDGILEPRDPVDLQSVFDVPVKVSAVLGRSRMKVSDLMKMDSGTIVELDRKVGESIDIFVNDRLIARGEVVLVENQLGITMTELINQD